MENNEFHDLFLSESQELLNELNKYLINLEKNPTDVECFDEIFRHSHTLKGIAAAMGYEQIVNIAHAMESILDKVRKDKKPMKKIVTSALFNALDFLENLYDQIHNGTQEEIDIKPVIENLENMLSIVSSSAEADIEPGREEKTTTKYSFEKQKTSSVRVSLDRLESLTNTVGELITNKIRIRELARTLGSKVLIDAVAEMERIANRLQDDAMRIRLISLEYLLRNFPRMVRDEARKQGKEVNLVIEGADIGVDRTVLDEINDPLIHILRNAVSHGIEPSTERKLLGKPIIGTIKISAHRERNFVVLEISDDGYGLDKEKIKAALLAQERITPEELAKLTEAEIFMLVTLPGFSLSKQVTTGSGRGVGMNVVRNKVEAIGGSFAINSITGQGCTVTLRLPFTLAIIQVMLVEVGKEIFSIQLANIAETIEIDSSSIKRIEHKEVIPYRNSILPLIRLKEKLGYVESNPVNVNKQLFVVVCEIFNKKIGLIVDRFVGQQEVVAKNLTGALREMRGFSGATILSSGRVAMILDLINLIEERTIS